MRNTSVVIVAEPLSHRDTNGRRRAATRCWHGVSTSTSPIEPLLNSWRPHSLTVLACRSASARYMSLRIVPLSIMRELTSDFSVRSSQGNSYTRMSGTDQVSPASIDHFEAASWALACVDGSSWRRKSPLGAGGFPRSCSNPFELLPGVGLGKCSWNGACESASRSVAGRRPRCRVRSRRSLNSVLSVGTEDHQGVSLP